MTALADGDLRVEQRRDERDWATGRADQAAPEDEQSEERITDARR